MTVTVLDRALVTDRQERPDPEVRIVTADRFRRRDLWLVGSECRATRQDPSRCSLTHRARGSRARDFTPFQARGISR